MLQRCAAASLQPPELCVASQRVAPSAAPAAARQPRHAGSVRSVARVELHALPSWAVERVPLHLACAGFACTLLLSAHSATAAAEAAGLGGLRCAIPSALLAVAFADVPLPSAVRDETERVLAEELAQRCARGYAHRIRSRRGLLSRVVPARSFRRLPEDEQVALVERLLRRAIASDASSRGARSELQTAPLSRQRADAEPDAEPAEASTSRKAPLPPAAAATGPAAAPGAEPTSALDAQDGWDGAASTGAPPLALELEKLLPSAQSRPQPAAARSPAAGVGLASPAGITVASQAGSNALFSGGLTLRPLIVTAAAGAAVVLGSIAFWLSRGRAADANATPSQSAPTGDRPQAPPDLSARVAAPEGVDATATRRSDVLWSRKEKPSADASAADTDVAAPSVLWKRGAPRLKPGATQDAPAAAGDAKEPAGAAELSDNAEGLRFGARLKQPPN